MSVSAVNQEIGGEYVFWIDNQTCHGRIDIEGDKVFESSWTIDNNASHKFEDDFSTDISVTACTTQDIICPAVTCPAVSCPEQACNCPEIDYSKFPAPSCTSECPQLTCPECDVNAVIEDGKKLNYKDAGIGAVVGLIIGAFLTMNYVKGKFSGGGIVQQSYTTGYDRPVTSQGPTKELPRYR
jgi:hypothetical protein